MSTIIHTIARGLYCLENRVPRFKTFSQKIASFISGKVSRDLADIRQWSLLCSSARTGSVPGRKNCWEFTGCRQETHGGFANVLGVCPAALESRLDGIHGGRNGGRSCWVVSGTQCHGNAGKSYEQKMKTCSQCGFYRFVKWEEAVSFIQSDDLLLKLLQ